MRALLLPILLVAVTTGASAQNAVLLPMGSVWKYLDDGSNQETAWRASGFIDSGWLSGAAQLGYGDGDEAKIVGYVDTDSGTSGVQKNATTYFRTTFSVSDPSQFASLSLTLKYDDGGAIYINGTEAARTSNLVSNPAYTTFCTGSAMENATQTWTVPSTLLQAGLNTIAVEIHQISASSSDISFDLALTGIAVPTLTRGPYLQVGTPTGVVVRWRTDAACDSRVLFGSSPANLTGSESDATSTTEHEVTISGLTPDTRYYYAVSTSSQTLAGGDPSFFFTTSPVVGTQKPTRIWVIGDAGTANSNQAAVRDAYYTFAGSTPTDLWLMLGDNAYETGTDSEFQAAVFDMYPTLLRQSVVWPTLGNHETAQATTFSDSYPYFAMFTMPTTAAAGGLASGTEHYYSFDYANIHFVCLDSQTASRSPSGAMLTWLQNDLADTTQRWIIAFWHHPPYTKGSHDSDSETQLKEMRENALPILEAAGVDLVLSGHSHSYERSMLLDGHYGVSTTLTNTMKKDAGTGREDGTGAYGKDPGPHNGSVYAVAGSSGKISGGALNHPVMIASLNVLGSMILDVNAGRLDAKFLDSTGQVRDYFTLLKGPLVTLAVTTPTAYEQGQQVGAVTLSRTGNTGAPLPVSLSLGGTASNGADYQTISTPFTIPAGASSVSLVVQPLADTIAEGDETVTIAAANSTVYRLATANSAAVTIKDKPMDQWRFSRFDADANTASIAGDIADPDRDGIPNLLEYAFNLDPQTPSMSGLPGMGPGGEFLSISFSRVLSAVDLTYTVQVSDDLQAWDSGSSYSATLVTPSNAHTTETSRTGSPVESISVRDNTPVASAPKRFIRLQVTRE